MQRKTVKHLPKSPVGLRPFVWLCFGASLFAALVFTVAAGVGRVEVAQPGLFAGTLRPERNPAFVRLPAHVPLLSVLVEPGEHVRKGQTVALLDQALIGSRLAQVEREIRAAGVLRECLLSDGDYEVREHLFEQADDELQLLVREAVEECNTLGREFERQLQRIEDVLVVVRRRQDLLEQRKTIVLLHVEDTTDRAHTALEVALEQNQLIERERQLEHELQAVHTARDQGFVARRKEAAQSAASLMHLKAVLTRFHEAPRLIAPQQGEVSRVRPLLAGTPYNDAEELVELHDERIDAFEAQFEVTLTQSRNLSEGMQVSLTLLGYPEDGPVLKGVISALEAAPDQVGEPTVQAKISLEQDSLSRLADPAGGIALKGRSTASAIHVALSKRNLSDAIKEALRDSIPPQASKTIPAFLQMVGLNTTNL